MEKFVSFVIILGAVSWLASVLFMGGRWQWQMFSAAIIFVGIVAAHMWEEIFRKEDDED